MTDKWMNIGHEQDELKPYCQLPPDLSDEKRIGGSGEKRIGASDLIFLSLLSISLPFILFRELIYFSLASVLPFISVAKL